MGSSSAAVAVIPTEERHGSSSTQEKHDVFLSFRGPDTRDGFTSHLHAALSRRKIKTYMDNELEAGEEMGPALRTAIEESKISIIICSVNYAHSKWCLDELVHILERSKRHGQIVIPIFYQIHPFHVRYQKESYAAAFVAHKRLNVCTDQTHKWKVSLETASHLSGFDSNTVRPDATLVERVVKKVLIILKHEGSCDLTGLVGIESRIGEIESLLCIDPQDDRVRFVGIVGMGGIGKTTLADAVFHQFSPQYDAFYFLANVREESERYGLHHLRNKLFRKLTGDDNLTIETTTIDTSVKMELRRRKVLVVLDDVSDSSQLECLAGNQVQFSKGSRIIITTRDMQPLRTRDMQLQGKGADDVKIYEVKELKCEEALELFQLNKPCREPGKRSRLYTLEDVRHILEENTGTGIVRSISLNLSIMRGINLTAQAFKKMHNLRFIKFCNLSFEVCNVPLLHNLESLPNSLRYLYWLGYPFKSFPSKFYPDNLVEIHMPNSKLRTLWNEGQIPRCLKRIDLSYSTELVEVPYLSKSIESLNLNGCTSLVQVPDLSECVKIESIYLQGCTNLVEIPSYFQSLHSLTSLNLGSCSSLRILSEMPYNMEFLDLDWTAIEDLPLSIWSLEKLVKLNLYACQGIKNLPCNTWKMNSLKSLDLARTSVGGLPSSIKFLSGVVSLELKDCTSLLSLPTEICKLKFIKKLSLSRCCNFRNFPEILEPMASLEFLGLSHTEIKGLPSSVENLVGLKTLELSGCRSLEFLPRSIYNLTLEKIKLDGCCSLKELPSVRNTSLHG
ncbi:hypothetical protein M0R45_005941 [Rubus argutus]|uniref:TIR domain-containing protein n=1 Tax=Rubus argutus TaxID=59490 RepID=A0AAW1YP61_RUBAR